MYKYQSSWYLDGAEALKPNYYLRHFNNFTSSTGMTQNYVVFLFLDFAKNDEILDFFFLIYRFQTFFLRHFSILPRTEIEDFFYVKSKIYSGQNYQL